MRVKKSRKNIGGSEKKKEKRHAFFSRDLHSQTTRRLAGRCKKQN